MKRGLVVVFLSLVVLVCGLGVHAEYKGTIYYMCPSLLDEFQPTSLAAIEKGVKEAGYKVISLVAGSEDITLQINQMEDAVTQNPVAIIVNPVNSEGIVQSIDDTRAAGIPVIVYDRTVTQTYVDFTSMAGTKEIGIAAGHEIARLLKEKYGEVRGTVLDIMGDPGDNYTVDIEEGFREVMLEYPDVEITTKAAYGWEATTGGNIADDWLVIHPDTDLIFPHADHMTQAVATVLEMRGYEKGEILLVSTAGMPMGLDLIRQGWCQVTVEQALLAQVEGILAFLDQVVNRQCPKPGRYTVGGFEATLKYEDFGPVLYVPGNVITIENVDDPRWWGNQVK